MLPFLHLCFSLLTSYLKVLFQQLEQTSTLVCEFSLNIQGKSYLTFSSSDKMDALFDSIVRWFVAFALVFASLQGSGKQSRTLLNLNDEKHLLRLSFSTFYHSI